MELIEKLQLLSIPAILIPLAAFFYHIHMLHVASRLEMCPVPIQVTATLALPGTTSMPLPKATSLPLPNTTSLPLPGTTSLLLDTTPTVTQIGVVSVSVLLFIAINFFQGRRENENIARTWVAKLATKGSHFYKNFTLLGCWSGKNDDFPLLLKEGGNVFRFYAIGMNFCRGLWVTMELKCRHNLVSRLYNMVVPCKDEITFEVLMNEDVMDYVVFAMAKKKVAKAMQKEMMDLQRFDVLVAPPRARKWVPEDLDVVSESEEVFGEKVYEKYGKGFISMHSSDQYNGMSKKMLVLKFALPEAKHMDEMTHLFELVPYCIDFVGRYKLSSQVQSKVEAGRRQIKESHAKLIPETPSKGGGG